MKRLNGDVDVIINIVDASNLSRNLYLTTQLKQFGKPIILVLNMIDVAEIKGIKIDLKCLSEMFNISILPIITSKNKGINELETLHTSSTFFK